MLKNVLMSSRRLVPINSTYSAIHHQRILTCRAEASFTHCVCRRNRSNVTIVCSVLRKNGNSRGGELPRKRNKDVEIGGLQFGDRITTPTEGTLTEGVNLIDLPIYKPTDDVSSESFTNLPLKCRSCGAFMQTKDQTVKGFISPKKLPSLLRKGSLEEFICSNCYYLRYANKPTGMGIEKDNVMWQIKPLQKSRALILYVVDIMDIGGSMVPEIMSLIGEGKSVIIVGNKSDMLACDTDEKPRRQENRIANILRDCCVTEGLSENVIKDVCLVSGLTGYGFEKLVVLINKYRDIDMNLYVFGSTNVGKSTVFNMLQNLSAISKDATIPTQAITHRIPGSTFGLIRHPLAYWRMKKVRRMLLERPKEEGDIDEQSFTFMDDMIKEVKPGKSLQSKDERMRIISDEAALERLLDDDVSELIDLHSLEKNKRWMYDTPGLLNDQQITQFLTPGELRLLQQKQWIVPKTFLMKPGRSLLLGGLARIDYCEVKRKSLSDPTEYEDIQKGIQSIYFTVFCSHNIPIHPTSSEKASEVLANNFGNHILKIPFGNKDRQDQFPPLEPKAYELTGVGWDRSCADLAIAGIGWIAVTAGKGCIVSLQLHTPNSIGQTQRDECLMPYSVTKRGKRGFRYAGVYNKNIYECSRKKNPQLIKSFERENEIMKAWLQKINEKLKYQLFEKKTERRRLLLEQGIKGRIRQYEEKLALIDQDDCEISALESGLNDDVASRALPLLDTPKEISQS